MKKSGFTLIELVIVLSILSCIISTSFLSYKFIKRVQDEQDIKASVEEIDDMITSARMDCLKYKNQGRITFEQSTGKYYFRMERTGYDKPVKVGELKGNIRFYGSTISTGWRMDINVDGIPSAGTIVLIDGNGRFYNIAIGVGNYNEEVHIQETRVPDN